MRILLVGLNARYVHTNLAIRYLQGILKLAGKDQYCVDIREFSINESLEKIAAEIFEEKPDMIGFSCYIWNITQILLLIRRLRPVLPKALFCLGGPEVSFDPADLLIENPEIDTVIVGEGEEIVPALARQWAAGKAPWEVKGVVWRLRGKRMRQGMSAEEFRPSGFMGTIASVMPDYIITNEMSDRLVDLDHLPNPYAEEEDLQGKLVYVETSRGCPFNCRFCISSTFRGVRMMSPEKFRLILRRLLSLGARTIKFVDRTFNADKEHAFAILNIFREEGMAIGRQEASSIKHGLYPPKAHCEMAGELLDQEWLAYLKEYPQEMIQLEIGVQSTHQPTLEAVNRPQHFARWRDKVIFLQHFCSIPVHLDLIAGLPHEGWQEFKKSFDDVYGVRPNKLQVGFLKVLKGSGIWEKRMDYGLVHSPDPPYVILETKQLAYEELLDLGRMEEILEMYANSGRFRFILEFLLREQDSPFDLYHSIAQFWRQNGWFRREWNVKSLFHHLWEFISKEGINSREAKHKNSNGIKWLEVYKEALRFDYYLLARPGEVPEFLQGDSKVTRRHTPQDLSLIRDQLRNEPAWQEIIPEMLLLDKRQWSRACAISYFSFDIPGSIKGHKIEKAGGWYLFFYTKEETQYYRV